MEYLKYLFQFEKYHIDDDRKVIIHSDTEDRRLTVVLSNSQRYLIFFERSTVSSNSDISKVCYTELNVQVVSIVYDLEKGTYYPIPQGHVGRLVKTWNIQISPDEQTAMILVLDSSMDAIITWWNLETQQIIKTIPSSKTPVWTLTNDYLVEIRKRAPMIFYLPNGEIFIGPLIETDDVSILNVATYLFVNGEIIRMTKYQPDTYVVDFYALSTRITRTVTFRAKILSKTELDISQIQQYLALFDPGDDHMSIIDMADTGKSLLDIDFYPDIYNWIDRTTNGLILAHDILRAVILQKQTLIKVLSLLLSVLHIPIYHELPETLQYMVRTILAS